MVNFNVVLNNLFWWINREQRVALEFGGWDHVEKCFFLLLVAGAMVSGGSK